jgi:hypothetical protein
MLLPLQADQQPQSECDGEVGESRSDLHAAP